MKTLILLRHAEPIRNTYLEDADRTLTEKGVSDAYKTAESLTPYLKGDMQVISSPAIRALHTAVIVMRKRAMPWELLSPEEFLWRGDENEVVDRLQMGVFPYNPLLIVGHNPVLERLTYALTGKVPDGGMAPGCGVKIDFDITDWQEMAAGKGSLAFSFNPNENSS